MPTNLCRLCFESSEDSVNVFEKFESSTIVAILKKHLWFHVNKKDGMSEWLCKICWTQIQSFHKFFKRMEVRYLKYCRSETGLVKNSLTKQGNASPGEVKALELDLSLVKLEMEDAELQTPMLISREENANHDDNSANESENSYTSNGVKQFSNKISESGDDSTAGTQRPPSQITAKRYNSHNRMEKEKQDAQIRRFFNMKCEICSDFEFESLLRARQHYRSVHKTDGYLVCCGKKFHRRFRLLDHIHFHINPDRFHCDQCDKSFLSKQSLLDHTEGHVPLDSRAHKCSLCTSSFARQSLLRAHVKNKHELKTGEKFPCETCGKNYRSSLLLACHIRAVHEFSREHVCETCAGAFKTKQILKMHISREHSETPKVQCDICGAWLKHKIGLRSHLKFYHEYKSNAVKVNCPICSKVTANKRALGIHMRGVHGDRDYQCSFCNKKFRTAKNLKEHVACHTGEDLYDCPYCHKKFRSSGNFWAHKKNAHSAEWSRDKVNGLMGESNKCD